MDTTAFGLLLNKLALEDLAIKLGYVVGASREKNIWQPCTGWYTPITSQSSAPGLAPCRTPALDAGLAASGKAPGPGKNSAPLADNFQGSP